MARIKIEDLPVNEPISRQRTKEIFGGQGAGSQSESWGWGACLLPQLEQDNLYQNTAGSESQKVRDPYSFTSDFRSSGL